MKNPASKNISGPSPYPLFLGTSTRQRPASDLPAGWLVAAKLACDRGLFHVLQTLLDEGSFELMSQKERIVVHEVGMPRFRPQESCTRLLEFP